LYDKRCGYFNRPNLIYTPPNLDFTTLKNQQDYALRVRRLYQEANGAWMTPVELFRPYYAQGIARWLVESHKSGNYSSKPLCIFEVGGGTGTCALNILDYLQDNHPDLYKDATYQTIEISRELAKLQRERLAKHGSRFKVNNVSVLEWETRVEEPCFVIALEVLDNMPHDKVIHESATQIEEAHIDVHMYPSLTSETTAPVSDPLVLEYLKLQESFCNADKNTNDNVTAENEPHPYVKLRERVSRMLRGEMSAGDNVQYLPTASLQFIHTLRDKFPYHSAFLADFDYLPGAMPGRNGPCINEQQGNRTLIQQTYLLPFGSADIFFPTDFPMLQHVYSNVTEKASRTMTHEQFAETFCDHEAVKAADGFNPLLKDYTNMQVFVTTHSNE
jgi:SAM-dependent MidA family methyltransferase